MEVLRQQRQQLKVLQAIYKPDENGLVKWLTDKVEEQCDPGEVPGLMQRYTGNSDLPNLQTLSRAVLTTFDEAIHDREDLNLPLLMLQRILRNQKDARVIHRQLGTARESDDDLIQTMEMAKFDFLAIQYPPGEQLFWVRSRSEPVLDLQTDNMESPSSDHNDDQRNPLLYQSASESPVPTPAIYVTASSSDPRHTPEPHLPDNISVSTDLVVGLIKQNADRTQRDREATGKTKRKSRKSGKKTSKNNAPTAEPETSGVPMIVKVGVISVLVGAVAVAIGPQCWKSVQDHYTVK